MARQRPSQIRSEIEIAQATTKNPTHSVQIMEDATASRKVQSPRDSGLRPILLLYRKSLFLVLLCAILGVPFLLLLFVAFVVLTMAQLGKQGAQYDKVSRLRSITRLWVVITFLYSAWTMRLVGYICGKLWDLNVIMLLGLSIANWFVLIASISTVTLINFVNIIPHFLPPIPLGYNQSGLNVSEALLEIVDCLLFLWCIFKAINKVPSLKEHEVLGLYSWKWLRMALLVVIGYNVFRLFTHLTAWLTRKVVSENLDPARMKNPQHKLLVERLMPREYLIYYTNGLKMSINFILCALLTLLTWVLYFSPRISKTPQTEQIILFGKRTGLSVFICSVLWLFKSWVVLSWEARAMYVRLRSQLLESKNQLYFLGILGRRNHDIFGLTYYGPKREMTGNRCMYYALKFMRLYTEMIHPEFWNRSMNDKVEEEQDRRVSHDDEQVKKLSAKKREATKYNLLMHNRTPNTHDIKQVADYLISAKTTLSDHTFVPSILDDKLPPNDFREKLKQLVDDNSTLNDASPYENQNESDTSADGPPQDPSVSPVGESRNGGVPGSFTKQPANEDPVIEDDWLYFEKMVQISHQCFDDTLVRTWMENAQNNCFFLANALSSTKEVVDALNTIVSCFLIGATVILWLLLTRLATTDVLVLIVSPLLAATFIFGDTCKTLFQGLMYVYVVHPIHVGDLCSVDDIMLVVQSVGVWTTTFCKVEKLGTSEVVTYPNSELAMKVVINNVSEFVWDDSLEFPIGSLDKTFVKKLKKEIKDYLEKEDESMSCSHTVKAVANEDDEEDHKIVIKLNYKITKIQHWSYFKCVRRKANIKLAVEEFIKNIQR